MLNLVSPLKAVTTPVLGSLVTIRSRVGTKTPSRGVNSPVICATTGRVESRARTANGSPLRMRRSGDVAGTRRLWPPAYGGPARGGRETDAKRFTESRLWDGWRPGAPEPSGPKRKRQASEGGRTRSSPAGGADLTVGAPDPAGAFQTGAVRLELVEQPPGIVVHQDEVPVLLGHEPLAHGMVQEAVQRVEVAGHVQHPAGLGVEAELGPGDDLEELLQGAEPARQGDR